VFEIVSAIAVAVIALVYGLVEYAKTRPYMPHGDEYEKRPDRD